MEDNRQDKDLEQAELNNKEIRRSTGHTWIGDKDEIRPDAAIRPVSRSTLTDGEVRSTRLVQKPRRPYTGFITEEELKHAEAAAEIDRRSRAEGQAARERLAQTRIYNGIGSGLDDAAEVPVTVSGHDEETPRVRPRRSITIRMDDDRKVRRLIAFLVVFALLIAGEISFAVMKAGTKSLPDKTAEIRSQTEQMNDRNEEIESESDQIGDYDEVRENRDSWQKIRDQLAK